MTEQVAAQLNSADWEYVLNQCSENTQQELVQQLAMMMEMMAQMQIKLRKTMNEIEILKAKNEEEKKSGGDRAGRGARGGKKARAQGTVNKKTTAELAGSPRKSLLARAPSVEFGRKGNYRFGSAKINYIKPKEGYPTEAEAKEKPPGELVLE